MASAQISASRSERWRARRQETVLPRPANVKESLSFSPQLLRNIRAYGNVLRRKAPVANHQAIGKIEILAKKEHGSPTAEGEVEIVELKGGLVHRIRVVLGHDAHAKASEAYERDQLVTCTGTLEKRGGIARLLTARDFAVIPDGHQRIRIAGAACRKRRVASTPAQRF